MNKWQPASPPPPPAKTDGSADESFTAIGVPLDESFRDLWQEVSENCTERKEEMRAVWERIYRMLAPLPNGHALLEAYRDALSFHTKDVMRTVYWRGYHVGFSESAPTLPPVPARDLPFLRRNKRR